MKFKTEHELLDVLHNWTTLTDAVSELSKEDVVTLLHHECNNKNRDTFVKRLSQRLNKINYDEACEQTGKAMKK